MSLINFENRQLGNYHIIRLLKKGNFADVYLGKHVYLKTFAAIKVLQMHLSDRDKEKLLKEAQILVNLDHPNITKVLAFDIVDDVAFLAMSYTPDGSLRTKYPRGSLLPLDTIIIYVEQVANALQYIHNQNLLHGKLKPENMLLSSEDTILLSDLDIANFSQNSQFHSQTPEMIDTVRYMAPEYIDGKPCPASDQYALGLIVYEWLSGNCPFNGPFNEIVRQQKFVVPPPLYKRMPEISLDVERVVMISLDKNPQRRFANVLAFSNALKQANQISSPIPTRTVFNTSTLAPKVKQLISLESIPVYGNSRHKHIMIIGLLVILAILVIGGNALVYFVTVFQPSTRHTQTTATAQAKRKQPTAYSQATASVAQATSSAMNATATVEHMSSTELYNFIMSSPPVLNASLDGRDANGWDIYQTADGGGCALRSGTLHALISPIEFLPTCYIHNRRFSNFAFQVQLTIVSGNQIGAGLVFRSSAVGQNPQQKLYRFLIKPFGYPPNSCIFSTENITGSVTKFVEADCGIKVNQANQLTVIAEGNNFYLYINGNYLTQVIDSSYQFGAIGVFAAPNSLSTTADVVFQNAKAWII